MAATRTQTNLRLSGEQLAAIEDLRRRGTRVIPRERYLRAVIDRHVAFFADDASFDASEYVRTGEDEAARSAVRQAVARLDGRRGQRSRLREFERGFAHRLLGEEVLDQFHDAVVICDMEFAVVIWNRSAERMFGWTASETLGRNALDLLPSDFTRRQDLAHIAMVQRDGSWSGAGTWYAKDGTPVAAEVLSQLVTGSDGKPRCIVGVFREQR